MDALDPTLTLLFDGLVGKNTCFPRALGARVEVTDAYAVVDAGVPSDTFNLVIS